MSKQRLLLLLKQAAFPASITVIILIAVFILRTEDSTDLNNGSTNVDQSTVQAPDPNDARRQALSELSPQADTPAADALLFANWLVDNDVQGFIGEAGWPSTSSRQANALVWLDVIEAAEINYTLWATGSKWPTDYRLQYFTDSDRDGDLDSITSQGQLVKNHSSAKSSTLKWGVNVAGLEFGSSTSDYSSTNPGILGENYFVDPAASYEYLSDQGVELVRLPFSWERLQPELYGELNTSYLKLIKQSVADARRYGIEIILDLHNYGRYNRSGQELLLGSTQLPTTALNDVWLKLHQEFKTTSNIYAYGLMNEPHNLPNGSSPTPEANWEAITQETLTVLREADYRGLILVPGYEWSKLQKWTTNHPTSWINDPLNNFAYEAHHYWDQDERGTYENE